MSRGHIPPAMSSANAAEREAQRQAKKIPLPEAVLYNASGVKVGAIPKGPGMSWDQLRKNAQNCIDAKFAGAARYELSGVTQ